LVVNAKEQSRNDAKNCVGEERIRQHEIRALAQCTMSFCVVAVPRKCSSAFELFFTIADCARTPLRRCVFP
jgi:hypothetical protein